MIEPGEAKHAPEPGRTGPGENSIVPAPPEASARRGNHPRSWRVEPLSAVEGGFLDSSRFYLRCTIVGVVALAVFSVLGLRLWSLEVVQGGRYGALARQQARASRRCTTASSITASREDSCRWMPSATSMERSGLLGRLAGCTGSS
jgi:hypothetical protein